MSIQDEDPEAIKHQKKTQELENNIIAKNDDKLEYEFIDH